MKKLLLVFCFVSALYAAENKPWTWKDRNGVVQPRAELDAILQEHQKWLNSNRKEGTRAELSDADLRGAELSGANLHEADLHEADLSGADLNWAILLGADLSGADLIGADLKGAELSGANLHEANLNGADLSGADLGGAELSMANLHEADLSDADLSGADLGGADLHEADLVGAIYKPKHQPPMSSIGSAYGLGYLSWTNDPEQIYALRKSLADAGFIDLARQVNAAIHRHGESSLERFLFDWTCEWGANWLRPLIIAGVLSLLCTLIYWVGMHFQTKSSLYLAATGERVTTAKGKERIFRIAVRPSRKAPESSQLELELEPKPEPKESSTPKLRRRLGWEVTALGTAFLFSLMSVFNIGFREFNFGRWIRMLQPREFDIRARGWMRTVSGIQSLIGVALVALALLSYFGRPFD